MLTKNSGGHRTKVLIVLYYYHPYVSGVSVCAKRLAEGLARLGYDVTVLTSRFDRTLAAREDINGVHVVRRPVLLKLNKGVIMPTFWVDVIRYALKSDYVNPHLPMADSGLSSLFIPKRKLVTTYQCDINLGEGLLDKGIAFVSTVLMHLQLMRSRVIVPSSEDYFVHSKMKKYAKKAKPIPPPVTATDFHHVDPKPLFDRLGVADQEVKIGFVGRIVYEKGIEYLLRSIPHLTKELADFRVIIAGDYQNVAGGSVKQQLDAYMAKYPGKILFTGYLKDNDLHRFFSGLDVLVLPSIDPLEAFGMVQIEAMLCGAPVVASDLPGVRGIVKKTGFGRISKIKDPEDIAKQIIEVVTYRQKYAPPREKVIEHFNSDDSIAAYANSMPKR